MMKNPYIAEGHELNKDDARRTREALDSLYGTIKNPDEWQTALFEEVREFIDAAYERAPVVDQQAAYDKVMHDAQDQANRSE